MLQVKGVRLIDADPQGSALDWSAQREAFLGLILIIAGVFIYFLPFFVARSNNKKNTAAIFALNLLAGWTFLGWVVAFVWALTKEDSTPETPTAAKPLVFYPKPPPIQPHTHPIVPPQQVIYPALEAQPIDWKKVGLIVGAIAVVILIVIALAPKH